MKVTSIKQQVRRQGRYSIFVEGKYAFSLSETVLLESGLHNGQELTEGELRELKQNSADDKLYNNVLAYIVRRPRSIWEIEQYLRSKNCSPSLTQTILNKLSNIGLVSDVDFARSWVSSRRLLKATSRRRLIHELHAKHISDEIIQQVLDADETDETLVLQELIMRKRKQMRYQDDQKLMQYLSGQGFSYGDIKAALQSHAEAAE